MYLFFKTRTDFCAATSMLGRHMDDPGKIKQGGALRDLHYIKATEDSFMLV